MLVQVFSAESFLITEVLGAVSGGERLCQHWGRNWSQQGGMGQPQGQVWGEPSPLLSRGGPPQSSHLHEETLPWLFFHRRWWSSLIFGNQHNFSCSRNLKISSPLLTNSLSTRTSQKKKPRHGDFNELTQGNKGSQEHTSLSYSPPQLPTKGITCSRRWISNQVHNVFVTE